MEFLVPSYPGLKLERTYVGEGRVVLLVKSTQPTALCPLCNTQATRVHSNYTRTLTDLCWADYTVKILLGTKRFYCPNPQCPKTTFAQRFDQAISPYARRTKRCEAKLEAIAQELGGAAGARLSEVLGLKVSRDTLLRILQRVPLPPPLSKPRVIGIDDWAWKKRREYGTIIVDLELRQPIDLLADCKAESVAHWLKNHPSVEVVSRDRGALFIDGVNRGAPNAIQVADRWHLLQSLAKALERFFLNHTGALKAANHASQVLAPKPTAKQLQRSQLRNQRMVENYEQIKTLHNQKVPVAQIAKRLGLSRETVYQYLARSEPPTAKRATYVFGSRLDPYKPYLIRRWNEGIRNASQLYRELVEQGVANISVGTVKPFITTLRRAKGEGRSFKVQVPTAHNQFKGSAAKAKPVTAKQVAHLFVTKPAHLNQSQQEFLNKLLKADMLIEKCYALTGQFCEMVKQRLGYQFEGWLEAVYQSPVKELVTFAQQLAKDKAAVIAGLTLEWSQGQVEGHIHRLKFLKRQMYGQAGFDLLKKRLLYRPKKAWETSLPLKVR
jgi:transposase